MINCFQICFQFQLPALRLGCFDLGLAEGAKVHAGFELYQAHPRWGCRMPFRGFDTNPPGATPVEHKSGRPITRTLNIIPLERFFPAPPTSVLGKGLHSSTSQLDVSTFCGRRWIPSVDRWVITRHKLDTKSLTDQNGLG
jgi:hypothetical protein